ncbi:glyoxylate/hydroxypyruvate reductase HPR3-like [Silene latifolia]|uniref:glyoxylate/hydroxypyruvate reductase HPR3-like n=1 Tax=Silene latifolia TaxID=37657 RepID=UPI003D76D503
MHVILTSLTHTFPIPLAFSTMANSKTPYQPHPNPNPNPKPLLLIHREPVPGLSSFEHLSSYFTLLDPTADVGPDREAYKDTLRAHAGGVRAVYCSGLSQLGKDTMDCLPYLKCVVGSSVGTDHIDLAECCRRGISVANIADAFSTDVAEYAVGLLLDVLRRISAADRFVRVGSWPLCREIPLGFSLTRKRVGIVGLGSIGSRVAKRLISFGCTIAYTSRSHNPSAPYPFYGTVHNLALESEILILCCTLNDQTRHMINKDVMTALGKKGILINVGRGGLIDEAEMVRFLVEGRLGGVGLDVYENEPSVPKELFGLDNVVMSPHQAVLTPESLQAAKDTALGNLLAFFANKPLLSPVKLD